MRPEPLVDILDWAPVDIGWQEDQPVVSWLPLGPTAFTDPFFHQTVARFLRDKGPEQRRWTRLDDVADGLEVRPGLAPTGFIFHTSRCGSTLVSRSLAALPQNQVIAECGLINALLACRGQETSEEQRLRWLRLLVGALGQRRRGSEQHFFIKFTSWNILALPLIRQAFPDVRWAFIYRHPLEVVVSLLGRPPGWMPLHEESDAAQFLRRLFAAAVPDTGPEEFAARVLQGFHRTVLEAADANTLLLNYLQLPDAIWSSLPQFFGIGFSAEERCHIQEVSSYDAKDEVASKHFTGDGCLKHQAATAAMRQAVELWALASYDKLEALRRARQGGA